MYAFLSKFRLKYIALTAATLKPSIHFVEEHLPGYSAALVPAHIALTHHYRYCEGSALRDCDLQKDKTGVNRRIWELLPNFRSSAQEMYDAFAKTCDSLN